MSQLSGSDVDVAELHTDVLIVGAGPVGMAAAILLAQQGVQCILLERHTTPYPLPRAVHLDGEVFRILQALGVDAAFRQMSRQACGLRLVNSSMRELGRFTRDLQDDAGIPQANMFNQPDLEELLRMRISELPRIQLLSGMEYLHSSRESATEMEISPILAWSRRVGDGKSFSIRTSYLLGADGADSQIRGEMGTNFKDLNFHQRWFVVDVDASAPVSGWGGVDQVFGEVRPGTYMHVQGNRHRWEFRLHEYEQPEDFQVMSRLRELIDPWVEHLRDDQLTIVRAVAYDFHARVAEQWRKDRTFLLGDAAHLTPPFIGQGLGAGLRDADNLAWKLAAVFHGAPEALLDSYELERKPHATTLIKRAVLLGLGMTSLSLSARLIRRLISKARYIPGIGRFATSTVTPRLRSNALSSTRNSRRLRGSLAPTFALPRTVVLGHTILLPRASRSSQEIAALQQSSRALVAEYEAGRGLQGFILVRPDGVIAAASRKPKHFARRARRYLQNLEPPASRMQKGPGIEMASQHADFSNRDDLLRRSRR